MRGRWTWAGGGGRRWPGLLAALVVLLQGLIPAAAIAHDDAPGAQSIQICTSAGLKLISPIRKAAHRGHGFGGLACEQCVMASLAAVGAEPQAPILPSTRVETVVRTVTERPSARPRAPPRPPSQGPPIQA